MQEQGTIGPLSAESKIKILKKTREDLELKIRLCEKGLLRRNELALLVENLKITLRGMVDLDTELGREIDKQSKVTVWITDTVDGYAVKKQVNDLLPWLKLLDKALTEFQPEFLSPYIDKAEYYFSDGEVYQARKHILSIFKKAKGEIYIQDNYLGKMIFEYLETISPEIEVKLLTSNVKKEFSLLYEPFKKNRQTLDTRSNNKCHDRFIILDKQEIWHLGASLEHAGDKAFRISKVVEQEERDKILADFDDWWNDSTQL